MAEKRRKMHSDDVAEPPTEASAVPAEIYDDEDSDVRVPIDLNESLGLADVIAEASRIPLHGRPEPGPATPEVVPLVESPAIRAEMDRLREDAKRANENYLRSLADVQNMRRRTEEERSRTIANANERLIRELLPLLDDFDLAVVHAKQNESYEQLIGGVEAILRKFTETLSKQGVEPIKAVGEKFDPDIHEAVVVEENDELPDETVSAELRKGYTMHMRVMRPSLVKVTKKS